MKISVIVKEKLKELLEIYRVALMVDGDYEEADRVKGFLEETK